MIVVNVRDLERLVEDYLHFDSFCVDVETIYTPTPEELDQKASIEGKKASDRSIDEKKWLEALRYRATDPNVNEVFWIGLSTYGRSDAIAIGHPHGALVRSARREKVPVWKVYPEGDPRTLTSTGKLSNRKIDVALPPEFAPPPAQLTWDLVGPALERLFFSGKRIIGHNLKFDLKSLAKYFDGRLPTTPLADTIIAQHVLNENLLQYDLGSLIKGHFSFEYDKLGKFGVENFSFSAAAGYVEFDARLTWLLWQRLSAVMFKNEKFVHLYDEFLMPLYEVLMRAEHRGVEVDVSLLKDLRVETEQNIKNIIDRLIVDYGAPPSFNPNSGQHKADLLKKYKAPVLKRTAKTGSVSVDSEVLTLLSEGNYGKASDVASLLLDYASASKTLGTYLIGLQYQLSVDNFIHFDYFLHGTATGRLSCRDPNIQNIDKDSNIRSMFRPPKGFVFIIGDYDQIELRFIADRSKDPRMIEVFKSGLDVHRATAAQVLDKPFEAVTPDERQMFGKMPNFLIGYGGTAHLLAKKTGIPLERAEKVLSDYFDRFSNIPAWKQYVIRTAIKRAEQTGKVPYVETMLGRRRRLPDLLADPNAFPNGTDARSEAFRAKARAERQAVNAVIQGSASEFTCLAMINLWRFSQSEGFPIQPLINVHDEIVCIVPEDVAEEGLRVQTSIMESVVIPWSGAKPLKQVPVVVSSHISDRWQK